MPARPPTQVEPTDYGAGRKPFLSVVMPVHEGAEWIGHTLRSLASEPVEDLQVIVLDSSLTDSTEAIVEQFGEQLPITFTRRPDVLPWQTKTNLGVDQSVADYVCILHQDDLWLPGRVAAVRRWVRDVPNAVLHLASSIFIDRNGRCTGMWKCPLPAERVLHRDTLLERLLVQNFVSVPAPVVSREAWNACGGMDETLWYTADWDIWAKLAGAGPVVYHDEVTTAFRLHGSSLTVTGSRNQADFAAQMNTVLERHLPTLPQGRRRLVEKAARASIEINVLLAGPPGRRAANLSKAMLKLASLGPAGIRRYLRDARLMERVLSRVRAGLAR